MAERTDDHYPALSSSKRGLIDQRVDEARRVLWRAYQHGSLSEEEFASTLDRLEYVDPEARDAPEPPSQQPRVSDEHPAAERDDSGGRQDDR